MKVILKPINISPVIIHESNKVSKVPTQRQLIVLNRCLLLNFN